MRLSALRVVLAVCLLLSASQALAEKNLVWGCLDAARDETPSTTCANTAWRYLPGTVLVMVCPSAGCAYGTATWRLRDKVPQDAWIWACTSDVEPGSTLCPNQTYLRLSQVNKGPEPIGLTLTADRYSIPRGESATLTWVTTRLDAVCTPSWVGTAVNPIEKTTYRVDCRAPKTTAWAEVTIVVTEPQHPVPPCWPTKSMPKLEAVSGGWAAFWLCEKPDGIKHWAHFFQWDNAAEWAARGILPAAEYDAWCAKNCRTMTANEQLIAASLLAKYGSVAVARANSTYTSRPVYARNADGTRGALVSTARVAVGARCDVRKRLTAAGKGTDYYSVQGQENVLTAQIGDLLGNVYTLCDRTDKIGLN
jgi:hypothetical protein